MEDAEEDMPGRTRVRELLIAPLAEMGLKRKRSVSAEAHARSVERVVERLAYMTPAGLRALLAAVERLAGGPLRNEWPSELVVVRFAWSIEAPPPESDRLVTSWMRSAAGRRTWAESPYLAAELARHLVKARRPPMDGAWPGMRERAARRRREVEAAQRRAREGRDSEADRAEIAVWRAAEARTRALVFERQGKSDERETVSDAA